jgi:hypothetical protein
VRIAVSADTFAMRASSDPIAPGQDQVRASDAEREDAIDELRDRFAEGRLSQETFVYRMDAALRAKFPSELSDLFVDLPRESGRRGPGQVIRDQVSRLRLAASGRRDREPRRSRLSLLPVRTPRSGSPADPRYDQAAGPPVPVPVPAGPVADHQAWMPPPQRLMLPRQADRRLSIGRAPSCDFTVPDISVSRWHAKLHKDDEQWVLTDLGSTNGTRLNGWRVTSPVPVRPGDHITFGNAVFVLTDDEPAPDQAGAVAVPPPGTD